MKYVRKIEEIVEFEAGDIIKWTNDDGDKIQHVDRQTINAYYRNVAKIKSLKIEVEVE